MAKDDRLYGKFTLDFADSPKIAPLSDAAFRTLVEMTLWSRRMLTDGFVPERVASKFWQELALAELCQNDPERPSLIRTDRGYEIHDFTEHQTTKADIEAKKAAGRLGGLAKASKTVAPANEPPKQTASKPVAKTETEAETEAETDGGSPVGPTPFCKRHPEGTDTACAGCKKARIEWERTEAATSKPTVPEIRRDPECPLHPGYPLPCDKCKREGT